MDGETFFNLDYAKWLTDSGLSMCSPATRGVWIDLICVMYQERKATITGTCEQLARLSRCSPSLMSDAITELKSTGAAGVRTDPNDSRVSITCRYVQKMMEVRDGNRDRQRKRRAEGLGDPEEWTAIRVSVLERDDYKCAYCGQDADSVDHVIPRKLEVDHDLGNLMAACTPCNSRKQARSLKDSGMTFHPNFDQSKLSRKCHNALSTSHSSSLISWDLSFGFRGITTEKKNQWVLAFPGVNLEAQIARAHSWLCANPTKRKKNNERFLTNWLGRAQENGRDFASNPIPNGTLHNDYAAIEAHLTAKEAAKCTPRK